MHALRVQIPQVRQSLTIFHFNMFVYLGPFGGAQLVRAFSGNQPIYFFFLPTYRPAQSKKQLWMRCSCQGPGRAAARATLARTSASPAFAQSHPRTLRKRYKLFLSTDSFPSHTTQYRNRATQDVFCGCERSVKIKSLETAKINQN